MVIIGFYFIQAARYNLVPFFKVTVYGRFMYLVGFSLLVILGIVPAILLSLCVIDVATAIWTGLALREK